VCEAELRGDIDTVINGVNVLVRILKLALNRKRATVASLGPGRMIAAGVAAPGLHVGNVKVCVDKLFVQRSDPVSMTEAAGPCRKGEITYSGSTKSVIMPTSSRDPFFTQAVISNWLMAITLTPLAL